MRILDKILCLNLDRRPDRFKHFIEQCAIHAIPEYLIERFAAIDGKSHEFSEKEKALFTTDYTCIKQEGVINKVWANQLGHYYMMKKMVENNYDTCLIVQDDVIFCKDFMIHLYTLLQNMPEDTQMLNIGLHAWAWFGEYKPWNLDQYDDFQVYQKQKINEYVCTAKDDINPASLAYIITLEGAKKLINTIETKRFHTYTDHYFNQYLMNKQIFYMSRKLLCTGNPKLGSDIFVF